MSKKAVVLCIDDDKTVLLSIKSQLKDFLASNYTFEMAESGVSALEILDELLKEGRSIPLAIVDYLMPNMKGDEILINIHKRSPQTLCIMLTGQADLSAVANAINNEALFRFMSKPWNKDDLILTIGEVFYRYKLEEDLASNQLMLKNQNIELDLLNAILKEKIEVFYRFVPKEFLKGLNIDPIHDQIKLGNSVEKEVAVLFLDIRSFTEQTQHMTSMAIFEFVNSCINIIAPIISKNEGFIDKFIGDGILSIFFDPNQCVNSVLEILQSMKMSPDKRLAHLKLGFSLNYGIVQMGVVGFENRMETTVIGTPVNIVAKIEKLNKIYNTTTILTEDFVNVVDKKRFQFKLVSNEAIPGIKNPINLYTLELDNET